MSVQTVREPPGSLLMPTEGTWLRMPYLARTRWARRARRFLPDDLDLITPDEVRYAVLITQGRARPARPSRPSAISEAVRLRPPGPTPTGDVDAASLERFEAWARVRATTCSRRQVDVELTPADLAAGWTLAGLHGAHGLWRAGHRDELVVAGHRLYERRRKERLAALSALYASA